MQVGILGGTFDPVHLGHLSMAEEARIHLGLERVLFVPAGRPWLKEGLPLAAAHHRVRMVEMAVVGNPSFQVCLSEVERPGPTYTVDTLEELSKELGVGTTLHFILGLDAMEDFRRWKEPDRVLGLCHLVVVARPGHLEFDWPAFFSRHPQAAGRVRLLSTPLTPVSGTEIRRRAAAGISLRYQVPDDVADYIRENRLYQSVGDAGETLWGAPGRDGRARLLQLAVERGALRYGRFTLASGAQSSYYFDGRLLSLDPEGAELIAGAMLPLLRDAGVAAVGGPTLGADPIVAAIAVLSQREGNPLPAFIVRKEAKAHGTGQAVEGPPLIPGSRVAIIDDVCTTGGSLFHAIAAAEAAGCQVVKVVAVLDRRQGGSAELRARGYDVEALLEATPEGTIQVCRRG